MIVVLRSYVISFLLCVAVRAEVVGAANTFFGPNPSSSPRDIVADADVANSFSLVSNVMSSVPNLCATFASVPLSCARHTYFPLIVRQWCS